MSAELDAKGVGLAAISVDEAEDSARLARELDLPFPLLHDRDLHVALAYGTAMAGQEISVPAIFIVLPDRRIAWSRVGETIASRPTNDTVMAQVDRAIDASRRLGHEPRSILSPRRR